MMLIKVDFLNGRRTAYTRAGSIEEAVKRVRACLAKDSVYTKDEAKICAVEVIATETWPGVFGG